MTRRALPLLVMLTACTVGQDYRPPDVTMPARFAAGSARPAENPNNKAPDTVSHQATAAAAPDLVAWWHAFGDPTLDALISQATRDNLDLQAAVSRIREARMQEVIAGAPALPTLGSSAQFTRTHLSGNAISLSGLGSLLGGKSGATTAGSATSAVGLPGADYNTWQLGFDASWELDLFGKTRRGVEAARDSTGAAIWNRRDSLVSLTAEVADTWFALRAAQRRLAVNQRDLQRQLDLLSLVRVRAGNGLASGLDVAQQQAQLIAASATLPPLRAEAAIRLHALAVLLGEPPETLAPPEPMDLPPPPPVQPGLPSDLLRRRPDIRSAERQLAAATANIGVAVADFYPQFSLTASPALVSTSLSNLVTWGSRNLSLGAGLSWNLFNGGQTRANVVIAGERQTQALLAWRKTVLTALQDVEDALSRIEGDQDQLTALDRSVAASRSAATLARDQYRAGLIPLSTVLTTEAALLTAEDQQVQADATLRQDLVALCKALGGGWQADATGDGTGASRECAGAADQGTGTNFGRPGATCGGVGATSRDSGPTYGGLGAAATGLATNRVAAR
jgi:NodT family efflux transporter outer membrane factor (OMF) lipoprotein